MKEICVHLHFQRLSPNHGCSCLRKNDFRLKLLVLFTSVDAGTLH